MGRIDRRGRLVAPCVAAFWLVLVAACAGSQEAKGPPSNCGGPVYLDRRCEALACGACAAQMGACSANDSCNRLAHCMLGCKHSVSETCGMICVHGEDAGPEATLGLGLYHEMLGCTSRAHLSECGPDS